MIMEFLNGYAFAIVTLAILLNLFSKEEPKKRFVNALVNLPIAIFLGISLFT